jgi:hypothetical protein
MVKAFCSVERIYQDRSRGKGQMGEGIVDATAKAASRKRWIEWRVMEAHTRKTAATLLTI